MGDIRKRLRRLEIYAVVSTSIFLTLALAAFKNNASTFGHLKADEITVERINVVEKSGQLRAVIANSDRLPDPVVDGKAFKTERVPGMIFYNGLGDECGGLIFGAVKKAGDGFGAYGGFTFDQYRQSQSVGLIYNDHDGSRQAGLSVWDRPKTSIIALMQRREMLNKMPDGEAKNSALAALAREELSPTLIFVGRTKDAEAKVALSDAKGNPRINMVVDATGNPRLDFLDQHGKVVYSLPKEIGDR